MNRIRMAKETELKPDELHSKLTNEVISKLNSKRILTVMNFVALDCDKLSSFTQLSIKDLLDIKQTILHKFGGKMFESTQLNSLKQHDIISTKISSIDNLLNGGLYSGQIYEFCGVSATGKTQLCLTIASNIVFQSNFLIHYIDTKRDFSASRVAEILQSKQCSKEDVTQALNQIRICRVGSIKKLFMILDHLFQILPKSNQEKLSRIIIIDSLPGLLFKTSNDHQLNYTLNRLTNILRRILDVFNVSIITVNLITQWNVSSLGNSTFSCKNDVEVNPTLGKYWSHIPNSRLFMQSINNETKQITVWKSFQLKTGSACTVKLNCSGIT